MQLHLPEVYEAHRLRGFEQLNYIATELLGCSIAEAEERNWKMAARGRPKAPTQAQTLLEALDFISCGATEQTGLESAPFIRLKDNMAVSFNGQIAAGYPIVEELSLYPRLDKFKSALQKCGKTLVISETDTGRISVKGDKLRALVNCMEALPEVEPDPLAGTIGDIMKQAFRVCGSLASEAATSVIEASVLLDANVCTGTNRRAMLQYWHGYHLPPKMVLPKLFVNAVAKQARLITGFGFSWAVEGEKVRSVTIYFDNGAWIKTLCYEDTWPGIERVIDIPSFPVEAPKGLFDAVGACADFSETGFVWLEENRVMSHETDEAGAQYEVKGLANKHKFNAEYLGEIAPYAALVDLSTYPDKMCFAGGEPENPVRGVVMGAN